VSGLTDVDPGINYFVLGTNASGLQQWRLLDATATLQGAEQSAKTFSEVGYTRVLILQPTHCVEVVVDITRKVVSIGGPPELEGGSAFLAEKRLEEVPAIMRKHQLANEQKREQLQHDQSPPCQGEG